MKPRTHFLIRRTFSLARSDCCLKPPIRDCHTQTSHLLKEKNVMRTSEMTRTAHAPALSTCFSEELILKIANTHSLSKSQLVCLFILLIKVGPCCQEQVTSFPNPTLKRPPRNFSSRTAKADARGWGKLWDNRKSSRGKMEKQKIQVWARLDQKQKEMWVTAILTARIVFDVWVEEMSGQAMAWSLEEKELCPWCHPWQAHSSLESRSLQPGLDLNRQGSEWDSTKPSRGLHSPGHPPLV